MFDLNAIGNDGDDDRAMTMMTIGGSIGFGDDDSACGIWPLIK